LDVDEEVQEGAVHNEQNAKKTKCAVIKTSTRQVSSVYPAFQRANDQTVFLPIIGLVPHAELRPSDLIGVNKDSYLILDKLPEGTSDNSGACADGRIRRASQGDGG
jgi:26S proteasome regulatory subunit T5